MLMMYSLAFMSGSFLVYSSDYLIQQPPLLCKEGDLWVECEVEDACEDGAEYTFDYNNPAFQDNWVTEFDLICK